MAAIQRIEEYQPYSFGQSLAHEGGMQSGGVVAHKQPHRRNETVYMDDSDLKKAYANAAYIVTRHGEKYLPIFSRLEDAYKEVKKRNSLLTRAEIIANSIRTD